MPKTEKLRKSLRLQKQRKNRKLGFRSYSESEAEISDVSKPNAKNVSKPLRKSHRNRLRKSRINMISTDSTDILP